MHAMLLVFIHHLQLNFVLLCIHTKHVMPALCDFAANVYSILPDSGWKSFSVYIMLIHNISAFTLHTNPLLYMWERLIKTHHSPWYIKLPSRLPICEPLVLCHFLLLLPCSVKC